MTTPPVQVERIPPDEDEDHDEDTPSSRITVSVIDPNETMTEATTQLFDDPEEGRPERFAAAVVRLALGCARARGTEYAWAMEHALREYGSQAR